MDESPQYVNKIALSRRLFELGRQELEETRKAFLSAELILAEKFIELAKADGKQLRHHNVRNAVGAKGGVYVLVLHRSPE